MKPAIAKALNISRNEEYRLREEIAQLKMAIKGLILAIHLGDRVRIQQTTEKLKELMQ